MAIICPSLVKVGPRISSRRRSCFGKGRFRKSLRTNGFRIAASVRFPSDRRSVFCISGSDRTYAM
jgi:hypothetical protein